MKTEGFGEIVESRLSAIRDVLGSPSFEAPGVLLYQGDAMALISKLPPETFDLTITSPPYNIGKAYETPLPLSTYLEWTESWIREIHRITKPAGAFWLNLGYIEIPNQGRAVPLPYLVWNRIPFYLVQEVVWNYGAGVAARRMLSPRNEKFLWYVKSPDQYTFNLDAVRDPNVKFPNQKKHGKIRVNQLGKNPTDVWQIPKVTTGEGLTGQRASRERTNHPAQFPVAVIDRIIKACSMPYDLVLDPFVGSGTTSEAAIANDRVTVGFEIKPEYIKIAADRLKRYLRERSNQQAQGRLFSGSNWI